MKKILTLAFAAVVLAACNSIKPVDPAVPADVGDGVTVSPQIAWGRVGSGKAEFWTTQGIGLDELHFYTGIEDGKAMVDTWSSSDRADVGLYKSDMLPNDVMDLVTRSLGKMGYKNVHSANLAPAQFGSTTGFRFDLTLDNPQELDLKGLAFGAQRDGKLDLILFLAPTEYYFGQSEPVVEKVFGSVQTAATK